MLARKNHTSPPNSPGGYRIRPYVPKNRRKLRCRGAQCAPVQLNDSARFHGRTLFAPTAHIRSDVGGGVAGSRSDQSPSGALKHTSGPALRDDGARCAPPSADAPANTRTCRADIESAPTPTKIWPRRGQTVGRRKSVKKNAALLHFLAFPPNDHPFGVPRGRAPWAGPPALSEVAGTFFASFLGVQKGRTPGRIPLQKVTPQGGVTAKRQAPNALPPRFLLAFCKKRQKPPRHRCPHRCAVLGNAAQLG